MSAFTSMFWREKPERNSLTPNSFAIMPKHTFHNYAIEKREHDDCEEPNKNIWGVFTFNNKHFPFPFYSGLSNK